MDALSHVEWRETDDDYGPWLVHSNGQEKRIAWAPQEGSQSWFCSSPVFETVIEGPRGTAKTNALLGDFGQDVGTGLGTDWNGILFRQTYKAFGSLIREAKEMYGAVWGDNVTFRESKGDYLFRWTSGETLSLHVLKHPREYDEYHGQQIPWIGFEELTKWPDPECYLLMFSCCRSKNPKVRSRIRSTMNPGGVGHNWNKRRFHLPVAPGDIVGPIITEHGLERVAIHSKLSENKVLLRGTPDYIDRIRALAATRGGDHLIAAWIDGSWDIVAGGAIDDIWQPCHVINDVPLDLIPRGWRVDRSMDHGLSKPFSIGWWAESNGEIWELPDGRELGKKQDDIYRVAEWYGWNGQENEGIRMPAGVIARGILDREIEWGIAGRVRTGPADRSIFDEYEPNKTIAGDMAKVGVRWEKADKGPGSRKQGLEQVRKYLLGAIPSEERENPGLWVCRRCDDGFIRTVPVLPRSEKDPDDVDTDAEDHAYDEVRYRLRAKRREVVARKWK